MKINKFTKKKNGMYNITFENGNSILVHEDIILKYDLLIKKEIDEQEEKIILKENTTYVAYDLAIKYITSKMRTKKELIEYLNTKEISNDSIAKIINMLEKNGYINDVFYTELFINDKILLSNDGPNKISKDLANKGIKEETIQSKITNFSKELQMEKIEKIVTKMINTNRNKSSYMLKNKIIDYLTNLGYEKSCILEFINDIEFKDNDDLIKKEYDKIYKKLSKKYSGKELEYKVKQKMYLLGFKNFYQE